MKIEDLLNYTVQELEALSDEELAKLAESYWCVTRPDGKQQVKSIEKKVTKSLASMNTSLESVMGPELYKQFLEQQKAAKGK